MPMADLPPTPKKVYVPSKVRMEREKRALARRKKRAMARASQRANRG